MKRQFFQIIMLLLAISLCGCFGRPTAEITLDSNLESEGDVESPGDSLYVPGELVGIFETKEQAESAAGLYGIELISYQNEVAVFTCDGDPRVLIEQGEMNGWPQLSLNSKQKAF